MKLSPITLTILKNFSMYNQHIVIEAGNIIRTVNEKRTMMIQATVEDEFPTEVALHDLSGFLKIVSLFEDPSFEFGSESVVMSDGSGAEQEYFYSEKEDLVYESRAIPDFKFDIEFSLPSESISKVLKGASANGVEDIAFVADKLGTCFVALDKQNPKRTFKVAIEGADIGDYKAYMRHSKKGTKLNLLPLDYTVGLASQQKVVQFTAVIDDADVGYTVFFALEEDSEF